MPILDWDSLVKDGKVFIVHGRDKENLLGLQGILEKRFKLKPVVLSQLPDLGRTIIEKFEQEAEECCYAVVLMTPDDHVQNENGEMVWQPRLNVMFELGWFCARLGREKVLFLLKKGTRLPSDFDAVLRKTFQDSVTEDSVVSGLEVEFRSHGIVSETLVREPA